MRLILISRVDDERALDYTFSLGNTLAAEGHAVSYEMETAQRMGKRGIALEKAAADAAVVIGGDGTVLRTVQELREQLPIIGINYGEVGFLADLEPDDAALFLAALTPPLPVEQR
ncbi:MAG: NAD(+)/NADH kinase, partial [Methanomicrobiales archaeon]|nr:NAD(+)/NADH kinase [Methanomicrobiales archaeon]